MTWLRLLTGFLIYSVVYSEKRNDGECKLQDDLVKEIHSHKDLVDKIIQEVTSGSYKGIFYNDLYSFIERFGNRMTGTEKLNNSIKYLSDTLSKKHLVVKLEDVKVPQWARVKEMAFYSTIHRKKRLRIKAMGNSPSGNIMAPLMVVKDIAELEARKNEAAGKIVLFNTEFKENLATRVTTSSSGPAKASTFKAIGALVRSVTPFSMASIHVGVTHFQDAKPIPAATITLEDADLLARIVKKENVTVELMITVKGPVQGVSQNLIADIPGKSEPNTYFSVTGHIDSWDVGQGVLDNAAGCFLAIHSLLLLKHMKIEPPRRTLRSILWTGDEMGYYGVNGYLKAHPDEFQNTTALFQASLGLFEPLGFNIMANQEGFCILKEIASLFHKIHTTQVKRISYVAFGSLSKLNALKRPLMQPLLKENNFEWFEHTEGDSMRQMNSKLMDKHLALISGTGYILANLKRLLPRND